MLAGGYVYGNCAKRYAYTRACGRGSVGEYHVFYETNSETEVARAGGVLPPHYGEKKR